MIPSSPTSRFRGPKPAGDGQLLHLPLPESDAALVHAVRTGREGAHEELVRRCTPDVQRILQRVLGPDAELEDVAHDVFVAAFKAIDHLREPQALRSWLVGIAIRKARKLIARRKRWSFIRSVAPSELPGARPRHQRRRVHGRAVVHVPHPRHTAGRRSHRVRATPHRRHGPDRRRQLDGRVARDRQAPDSRAQKLFVELARQNEVLAPWVGRTRP